MELMEGFKKNRGKILQLKDDSILFINQKNETSFSVFSTELNIICRSGRKIKAKYITKDMIQFHEGMFPSYLGTKQKELLDYTFDEFVKELRDFGADCGYTTDIILQ